MPSSPRHERDAAFRAGVIDCLGRAIDDAETLSAAVLAKARFRHSHAAVSFNERQRKIVHQLLNGFKGKLHFRN